MVLEAASQNFAKYRRLNSEATRISSFGDISTVSGSKIIDPLAQLAGVDEPSLTAMSEAIIYWMQDNFGVEEFVQAQKEFQNLTGRVFHDDYFYHQRMSYFLDYFCFQRPIQGTLRENDQASTPYSRFMTSDCLAKIKASPRAQQLFGDLANFRHSLFQIVKNTKTRMVIRDLYSKEKFEVVGSASIFFHGFTAGAILQGFVFILAGCAHLSQGVLIHPPAVARIIRKSVRLGKSEKNSDHMQLLTKLAKQNLALVRHRHLEVKKIYQQMPR